MPVTGFPVQVHHGEDVQRIRSDPVENGIREPLEAHLAGLAIKAPWPLRVGLDVRQCQRHGCGKALAEFLLDPAVIQGGIFKLGDRLTEPDHLHADRAAFC